MNKSYYYDVTKWNVGDPFEDVGIVINSIIKDIKAKQNNSDSNNGGKPGAVIYLPPADYHLKTQVKIDISFLKIVGSGHGFTSSSIRFNVPKEEWADLHELWPGGSRILNELSADKEKSEEEMAAFLVKRQGDPRISSVEFSNFCIDGVHFLDDGSDEPNFENTYVNGKTGIYVASAQDSFKFTGMGLVYLEHGITVYNADALTIHDNFVAECGNCIELRGWGQASKVTDNLIGAGFKGYSIYAENFAQLLVTANNIFPRGKSIIHLKAVTRSLISNNILHSFYPGMVILDDNSSENMVTANHFLRDHEPWKPMQIHDNHLQDDFGLLSIKGNDNSIIGNHFSEIIDEKYLKPAGVELVIIRVKAGSRNYISNNYFVAAEANAKTGESAYSAQVDSLLLVEDRKQLGIVTVYIDDLANANTVLDSGSDLQVKLDKAKNAFRAVPTI
ncbi:right-handed parallel beta-helix repeat-containing protein [Weissella paramesenteroides]|uniref:Right-handed parallel beta-helix repeat-containing protein n=1 Tax=Weissella paramesenteroides TaxID=1249 RepID=A0ABD4XL16_WEIPA|nr:NosD domain-containing protein [Weissella paramesenteroides]MDF8369691.1 right-handed parallel beta-helix repeat-containing protein [Weissella paramesenteroides]MDF8371741.1 right-handed parallel beta-helix repeat-containing protein [Weissella paramesenteroides]